MLLKATVIGHRVAGKGQLIGLITRSNIWVDFYQASGVKSQDPKNIIFFQTNIDSCDDEWPPIDEKYVFMKLFFWPFSRPIKISS